MTAADLLQLRAQLAHVAGLVVQGFVAACFLAFCVWVAPYVRNPPRR